MANHYTFGIGQPHTEVEDEMPPVLYDETTQSLVSGGRNWPLTETYTWATLPAAADYIGTAHVTDIGEHGSLWRSDGSTWGVVGGSVVLARSYTAGTTLTGTLTETLDYTYAIPAGLMGPDGAIEVQAKYTCTNSGNNKTFRVRMGGLAGTAVNDPQTTTNATAHVNTRIENRSSASSQIGSNGTFNYTTSTNSWRTSSVNTAVAVDLALTMQLANIGESITRESVRIVLYRP